MGDDYDDDGTFAFDDDWLYVEDEFGLADELAETQIADPGYSGTNEEINAERFEYDVYEFWDDLEYANDEYWDYDGRLIRRKPNDGSHIGMKRKRVSLDDQTGKRAKISRQNGFYAVNGNLSTDYDTVVFRSFEQRTRLGVKDTPILHRKGKAKAFAFMPDWRSRFANADPELVNRKVKEMPEDMKQAAEKPNMGEKTDEAAVSINDQSRMVVEGEEEEAWEDEDEEEDDEHDDDDNEQDNQMETLTLDPEMLKQILRERLGATGLEGMDEAAFMQTISKMLSGEGEPEDAAGDLASQLLDQANGSNDSALIGWLAGQGVNLEEEAEDDASSVATAENLSSGPANILAEESELNKTASSIVGKQTPNEQIEDDENIVAKPRKVTSIPTTKASRLPMAANVSSKAPAAKRGQTKSAAALPNATDVRQSAPKEESAITSARATTQPKKRKAVPNDDDDDVAENEVTIARPAANKATTAKKVVDSDSKPPVKKTRSSTRTTSGT